MKKVTEVFVIIIIHPETLEDIGAFHKKGNPITYKSEKEAAKVLESVKYPGFYEIRKYYQVYETDR